MTGFKISEFIPVDDIEDFNSLMESLGKKADAQVEPWQRELNTGDYFVRILAPDNFPIYGRIIDLKHKEDQDYYKQQKNLRWTKCYSIACPEGEEGSIHISSVTMQLSPKQFEFAQKSGWPTSIGSVQAILNVVAGGVA